MKKQQLHIMIFLTSVFAAFIFGLFLGRNMNQSQIHISVPAAMQTIPSETTQAVTEPKETAMPIIFPIDINKATKEELMALPGIGEVLAERILAYRMENGNFTTVEGLMNVEGIGEKRMEDIWDLIVIGG